MDRDEAWSTIHQERAALADVLETLTPDEWERPTLCTDWTVRDVAAHVISAPGATVRQVVVAAIRAGGSFARMQHAEAKRLSRRPVEEIAGDYRRLAGSRRLAPGTTWHDALLDVLVHTQDISVPLGRRHDMPVAAARESAAYVWRRSFPFRARRRLAGCRLEATDTDWAVGQGALVSGPVEALLLLVTGRPAGLARLSGAGVAALSHRLEVTR